MFAVFFFFNDTSTTEIYTLSLHDALPIWWETSLSSSRLRSVRTPNARSMNGSRPVTKKPATRVQQASRTELDTRRRSEEHTSELQSQSNLVCRLLLEKKKTTKDHTIPILR